MSTGTPTLAVLGWSDRAERLLPQLHAQGGFTVAGVGDRSATALIRARQATNAPCFQHTAEMVRRLDYDALLIADGASGSDLAGAAAARGAQLIAVADALPAAALGAAATAAVRHGVALALSRPLLHEPAIEALLSLLEDDPDWRPALAGIELRGPRPVEEQLRDAVALASGLLATSPLRVTAAAAPAANHLAAQLRYDEQALVVVGVTADVEQHASIRIEAPAGVEKVVTVGSVCSYPAETPVPFRESALWDGYPEQTNAPYGLAKKLTLVQQQAYRAQYGLASAYLLLANLYGPGDDFHPESSHVIPALIRKFSAAVEQQATAVAVWGSGEATREFLYVDDAAQAIVSAAERYDSPEPVNIGSGSEISIRALAECIARLSGFEGRLEFDRSRPDGQARRSLDVSRAREVFGWEAQTALEDGLRRTLAWWRGDASEQAA